MEAVRAIRATSRSLDRAAVVEVMGRNCGDIALSTALSTGSEILIVPEVVGWDPDDVARRLDALIMRGNLRATIVVAEGAWNAMAPCDPYELLKDTGGKPVFPGETMDAALFARVLEKKSREGARVRHRGGLYQRGHQPSAGDAAFAFGQIGGEPAQARREQPRGGREHGQVFHMDIDAALEIETASTAACTTWSTRCKRSLPHAACIQAGPVSGRQHPRIRFRVPGRIAFFPPDGSRGARGG